MVEQRTFNPKVAGSIPSRRTSLLVITLGSVAELAYAADLKSAVARLEGSSPSAPTTSQFASLNFALAKNDILIASIAGDDCDVFAEAGRVKKSL